MPTPPSHPAAAPPHGTAIECPLRGKGVEASHLQPFAETERYIEHLERADRAAWQKPEALIASLRLAGTETVADVGAGSGYFTFRFARALPKGRVVDATADLVFVCDVLHHVEAREAWLGRLFAEMKPGARLVLVEYKEGPLPQGPPESMKLSRAQVASLARGAGFEPVSEDLARLPYQVVQGFWKATW
jgi:predicted methyltransferase